MLCDKQLCGGRIDSHRSVSHCKYLVHSVNLSIGLIEYFSVLIFQNESNCNCSKKYGNSMNSRAVQTHSNDVALTNIEWLFDFKESM